MQMSREDAKEYILAHATEYLQKDRSGRGYICPMPDCGSGSGKKGTGITTKDKKHFTCWAGCFTNADIIDIIGLQHGLTDYNDKLKAAAAAFDIEIDSGYVNLDKSLPSASSWVGLLDQAQPDPELDNSKMDFTAFFLQANKNLEQSDYWKQRGLSKATADRFKLGYVAEWRDPRKPNAPTTPRLIIPITKYSYLARDTRAKEDIPENQQGYTKHKVKGEDRPLWVFNHKALREATQPIFVVEGEIDAMSIIEAGGEAVAIGSIAFVNSFLALLKENRPEQPLIISMDNEQDPEKREKCEAAAKKLAAGCQGLGIRCRIANVAGNFKDANEALCGDPAAFKESIKTLQDFSSVEEEQKAELERESASHALVGFLQRIDENKKASCYSTGFSSIDSVLDGGLYAGLYVVGAISSLGKTTFCLQIADHAAQNGHDVLIFSLEMGRDELIAKSISRETVLEDMAMNECKDHAKTTRDILRGYWDKSAIEQTVVAKALMNYKKYAKHIYITEGIGNVGVDEVRAKVENHLKVTGKAPIVLIDYLQILAPADVRASDKQNTDKAVLELKRLSRDFKIPVIGISSFNRENYTAPVNMASFKESGAVEYSSDVLIGLQYDGMDYKSGESEKDRTKRIRELINDMIRYGKEGKAQRIQVKILKNRNGSKGDSCLDFYPKFNYFQDVIFDFTSAEGEDLPDEWTDC